MPSPFDLSRAQLFLDDALIEQTVRVQRIVHRPVKYYGNPVYEVGAPWEGRGMIYLGGVYIDPADGLWKAWYVTLQPPEYPEIVYAVCLIVSEDGVHWRRPTLDVYRGHNGERTNIVLDLGPAGRTAAPSIIHEPDRPDEPWTMFISLAWPAESTHYRGYLLRSRDGVHWRWVQERPDGIEHGLHDRTTAFRGPDPAFPYVLIGRGAEDMWRWGLVRSAHRRAMNEREAEPGEPTRVVVPDLEDDPAVQVYHAYAFPYEGQYIGMWQAYVEDDDPHGHMELVTSRDTVHWERVRPRTSFLPNSPDDAAFDSRITDPALSPPVRVGGGAMPNPWGGMGTLRFYYWGGAAMHGNRHLTWGRGMGLAELRVDGFCSLRARRWPGVVTTKPLVWLGGRLLLNASCLGGGGNGSLRTEVLAPDCAPIDGFARADADSVANDGIDMPASWRNDPDAMRTLSGREIRLRFHIENYDLYSFRSSGG